jgi:hypothetical protein
MYRVHQRRPCCPTDRAGGAYGRAPVSVPVGSLASVPTVVAACGRLRPISHVFGPDDSVKTVVLLIGIAVGVDYALFNMVRSRGESTTRCAGMRVREERSRVGGVEQPVSARGLANGAVLELLGAGEGDRQDRRANEREPCGDREPRACVLQRPIGREER